MRRITLYALVALTLTASACSAEEPSSSSAAVGSPSATTSTSSPASSSSTSASTSETSHSATSSASSAASSATASPTVRQQSAIQSATTSEASKTKDHPTTYTCHYEEGDAPCSYAEYQVNKTAWAEYQAENNGGVVPDTSIARDANGWALGGPPQPSTPNHPTPASCATFRNQLHAWSDYQNAHRPYPSANSLPMSGQIQWLFTVCGMKY